MRAFASGADVAAASALVRAPRRLAEFLLVLLALLLVELAESGLVALLVGLMSPLSWFLSNSFMTDSFTTGVGGTAPPLAAKDNSNQGLRFRAGSLGAQISPASGLDGSA